LLFLSPCRPGNGPVGIDGHRRGALMRRLAGSLLAGSLAMAACADTATFTPAQDNSIFEDQPGNANGLGDGIFAGNNRRGAFHRRGLVAFDVSSLPPGTRVVSASLRMYLSQESTGVGPLPC